MFQPNPGPQGIPGIPGIPGPQGLSGPRTELGPTFYVRGNIIEDDVFLTSSISYTAPDGLLHFPAVNLTIVPETIPVVGLHIQPEYSIVNEVLYFGQSLPGAVPYPNSLIRLPENDELGTYKLNATFDFTGLTLTTDITGTLQPSELRIYGYNVEGENPTNVIESYLLASSLLPSTISLGEPSFVVLDTSTVISVCISENNLFSHIGVELVVDPTFPPFTGSIDTNRISFTACKIQDINA